ncbi:MAG: chemotaxis protein CheW [Bacilli bacterium]
MRTEKYIVFQLEKEEYSIPVMQVKSIEKMQPITRVPHVSPYIRGVMNLRGIVTPIFDLRVRFGLGGVYDETNARIIIIHTADAELGFLVDAANDVLDIDLNSVEPALNLIEGMDIEMIEGAIRHDDRLITVLKLDTLIESLANG